MAGATVTPPTSGATAPTTTLGLIGLGTLKKPLQTVLTELGFAHWHVSDSHALLDQLIHAPPQAVLLGGQLTDLDDLAACALLRRQYVEADPLLIQVVSQLEHLSVGYLTTMYRAHISDFLIWPAPTALIGHRLRQILRYHALAEALRHSEQRYQSLLAAMPDALVQLDDQGVAQWSKPNEQDQVPLSVGQAVSSLTASSSDWFEVARQELQQNQRPIALDGLQHTPEGVRNWSLKLAENGEDGYWLWARNDTTHHQMITQLQYARYYDGLTGLPNVALFDEQFGWMLGLARFHRQGLGLLLLRPSQVRTWRRQQGRRATEQRLRQWAIALSQRLHQYPRPAGGMPAFLARHSDDMFAVLWPGLSHRGELDALANALRVPLEGDETRGVLAWSRVSYPHDGDEADGLLDQAFQTLAED